MISLISGLGEFWVGVKLLPASFETGWRATIAVLPILKSKNKLSAIIVAFITVFSVVSSAKDLQPLKIPVSTVKIDTDPQTMVDVTSLFVNRQIHRGLMSYTSELQLVSNLADQFEVKDDGKVYVFKLKNASFSDGSPITAKDVRKTFLRMIQIKAPILTDLQSVVGFSDSEIAAKTPIGVEVIATNTVKFKLRYADPFFIKNLAAVDCSVIKLTDKLERIDATSGPYTFEKIENRIILSRRDASNEKSSPAKVELVKVTSAEQGLALASNGNLDSLEYSDLPEASLLKLKSIGWKDQQTQIARTLFLSLNPRTLSFMERQEIFSAVLSERGIGLPKAIVPGFGLIPSSLSGTLAFEDIRDLINNKRVHSSRTLKLVYPTSTVLKEVAEWIAKSLKAVGFKTTLLGVASEDYFKIVKSRDYDIMLRSKFLDYPDGMAFLTYFKTGQPINSFDAGTAKTDEMLYQAQHELDMVKRVQLYKTIQRELLGEYSLVPISNMTNQLYLLSPKIRAIKAHPMGFNSIDLQDIEIE